MMGRIGLLVGLTAMLLQQPTTVPDGPPTWVAFTADVVQNEAGQITRGRFFRASTGSTRMEADSPDGVLTAVSIHNFPRNISYRRDVRGNWASLAQNVNKPPKLRIETPGGLLIARDVLLSGRFDVYRVTQPDGRQISWLARELNYFEIRQDYGTDRRTRAYENIQVTEPAESLFAPPSGVTVRVASDLKDFLKGTAGPLRK
jgi:hypothetical protein